MVARGLRIAAVVAFACALGTARAQDGGDAAGEPVAKEPADPFAGKGAFSWTRGRTLLLRGGGSTKRLKAIHAALDWLARHQDDDGHWSGEAFALRCEGEARCDLPGSSHHDVGLTGLSLLAFLGAGEPQDSGLHPDTVRRGLAWLVTKQDAEGFVGRGGPRWVYDHMIASLALIEAYGMTGADVYGGPARRAVRAIHAAQNPYLAWRYGVRDGDNDTSVTVWAMLALRMAQEAGLDVDGGAFRGGIAWIEKMTEPEFGRVGYQSRGSASSRMEGRGEAFPTDRNETLTGMGVLARFIVGEEPRSEFVKKGLDLIEKAPPWFNESGEPVDLYGWQFETLAIAQVGGTRTRKWVKRFDNALVDTQEDDAGSCIRGSWRVEDPWTGEGGRVYVTAMAALTLEAHARYPRFHGGR